ncbi:hypothetical protein [Nonomuraea basaltis]|uniref:hypothetical protein n=1 Tax=Nonomuraea basaltis TaxID=2495887 RepID=UPI00110C4BF5|nr:hypothetical protein [Nonomuraea basaltis]TMR89489.1 hypothetical protein EJK15_60430 [Nonomuraea basaltis]
MSHPTTIAEPELSRLREAALFWAVHQYVGYLPSLCDATSGPVHVQEDWRCRSGMCFAGWVAQLAGGRMVRQAHVRVA